MRFQFIRDHQEQYPVALMCQVLKVSRSGFYAWLNRPECERTKRNRLLVGQIRKIHADSGRTYGSPRIHRALHEEGHLHGKNRVARLMRMHDLKSKCKRRYKVTTNSKHSLPVAPNLLNRKFDIAAPNQVWASDITYISTQEGWLYLAAVMDLYSRKIVGWSMSSSLNSDLVINAYKMAIAQRRPPAGLICHSDRGIQYASNDCQRLLAAHKIRPSMSRKGDCWDNSPMESFFATLKGELVHHRRYQTRREAIRDIFEYIEVFYNRKRIHSHLGYKSPADFEALAAQKAA